MLFYDANYWMIQRCKKNVFLFLPRFLRFSKFFYFAQRFLF